MRVVFIGSVEFSYHLLKHLLTFEGIQVVGIVTLNKSLGNADFCSLKPIADEVGIPCFLADHETPESMAKWIRGKQPDVIYCFGWSRLLKKEILEIPRKGVIGYHPTALPKNRGRHPIIWSLALGLKETASTFFFMDEGVDSGDILSQEFVRIDDEDDAGSLYRKLISVATKQLTTFSRQLVSDTYSRIPQDHSQANYWRKRTKSDGQIDWRMSARSIHNLVRALARPYDGAHCVFKDKEVKIWKTRVLQWDKEFLEPGKVLDVNENKIIVKCGEGAIEILEHEFIELPEVGSYL